MTLVSDPNPNRCPRDSDRRDPNPKRTRGMVIVGSASHGCSTPLRARGMAICAHASQAFQQGGGRILALLLGSAIVYADILV